MNQEHIDIIEVFLKKDLDIPLTSKEEEWLNGMDNETKESVFSLVNSYSYIEELVKVMNKIKGQATSLPVEQQQEIYEKCEKKKKKLEDSNRQQYKKII